MNYELRIISYLCILKRETIGIHPMGARIKKLKKIRIHREGTSELIYGAIIIFAVACIFYFVLDAISPMARHIVMPFVGGLGVFVWVSMLNFYRCPIRYFNGDTVKLVVAPADGKIVVVRRLTNMSTSTTAAL